jgi:hypothetical protein
MTGDRDLTTPLLEGDFYEGAFGPSILLILTSRDSITWLRALFDDLGNWTHRHHRQLGESARRVDRSCAG